MKSSPEKRGGRPRQADGADKKRIENAALANVIFDGADDNIEPDPDSRDKQIDIEVENHGQRRKLIIALAWPALAENFLSSLMSMFDMMMVGGLGAYAIAAVGLVTQPKFIMMAAFMALNIGTTALVARCKGARDPDGSNSALRQALMITVALTAIVCVTMALIAGPLIRWIAGNELSEQSILEGITYFRIQIYGFPTLSLTFAVNAALRGAGNTRAAFYNNTVANLVNVAFNYCMIGGNLGFPRWEVAGASIATVIGQFVGLLMAVWVAVWGKQYITIDFKNRWKIDFAMVKRIVNVGFPALIEQVIMRAGMLWFTTIVTALGDISYAAHMVAMNIQQLSFTTGMAFGTAATTLVGQSLGRKRSDLAKIYVRMTQNMGYIVSFLISIILFTCGNFLAGMYSEDIIIIALAADMLKIIALANPLSNARFVYVSALRGAGDSKFMAAITFVGALLARPLISLLLINAFGMGLTGAWIALVSDGLICFVISTMRYRGGKWALIRV
jgi:putative MATE family efflux protein